MTDDERAALKAELKAEVLAELKAEQPKPQPSFEEMERAAAKARDDLHQMRERAASRAARTFYSPDQLRAFEAACSTSDVQDIVRRGGVSRPSGQAAGQIIGDYPSGPANAPAASATGSARPRPFVPADDAAIDQEARLAADIEEPLGANQMSENEANRRRQQQIDRELAEAEANKAQLALDRWWQAQRDLAAEERRIRRP